MSFAVTAVVAGVAAAGTAYNAYQSKKGLSAQKHAQWAAEAQAERQAAAAEREFRRVNQKKPNIAAFAASNAARPGMGTMITGPGGVDPSTLLLGKTTPLGM